MSDDSISEAEYEFYYSLENDGEIITTVDKDVLKDILDNIVKLIEATTIDPKCEADFYDCTRQKTQYVQITNILQKITRL